MTHPKTLASGQPNRILVINVARIGDTLLVTPALRALRAAFPKATITCVAHPKRCEVLEGIACIDNLQPMTKRSAFFRSRGFGKTYDLALVYGRDDALLEFALRASTQVVAFAGGSHDEALAHAVAPPVSVVHAVAERLMLPAAVGVQPDGFRLDYRVSTSEAKWAADWIRSRGLTGRRLVGIQIASFPSKAYRDWPESYFRETARRLGELDSNVEVVLLGGPDDRARAKHIAEKLDRVNVAAGELTLRQFAAVMAHLTLYIGIDTGPTHLAGALGIPMVALYHCRHRGRHLAPLEHPAYLAVIEHPATDAACTQESSMAEIGVDAVWPSIVEGLTIPRGNK